MRAQPFSLAPFLFGDDAVDGPLPPTAELLDALLTLADGRRRKCRVPVGSEPSEVILARQGDEVLVSYLGVHPEMEIRILDRPRPFLDLLGVLADVVEAEAARSPEPTHRRFALGLVDRARTGEVVEAPPTPPPELRAGGDPDAEAPLVFLWEAWIPASSDRAPAAAEHADPHALLFPGKLAVVGHGHRVPLFEGPLFVAAQRLLAGAEGVLQAVEQSRPLHLRLRAAGGFACGFRVRPGEAIELELRGGRRPLVLPGLSLDDAISPILRLVSDLGRALVGVDRAQRRNLRLNAVRRRTRELRRRLRRRRKRRDSIVAENPDALRASSPPPPPTLLEASAPPAGLRFAARWAAEVEGLDASTTFLCGPHVVVATPHGVVCLDRDDGVLAWRVDEPGVATFSCGTSLLRQAEDGELRVLDPATGQVLAETRLRSERPSPFALSIAGADMAPTAVLRDGRHRLLALDLRTGAARWRYGIGAPSAPPRRVGRMLLLVTDGALEALDVRSGELLWRRGGMAFRPWTPTVLRDRALAIASGSGGDRLVAVDLYSGAPLFEVPLGGEVAGAPQGAGRRVLCLPRRGADVSLVAVDGLDGTVRWRRGDPGLARGASALALDDRLLVHTPGGRLDALSLANGRLAWRRRLAHPIADDVPRRLEPVLRSGALFVPSARVHALRPADGEPLGEPLAPSLIPDWLRVDERGWVYVAEESGQLAALAPRPHLRLLR
jgi:outer membrane protein assembly factor BamB